MAKRERKKITVPNIMYIFCEGEKTEPYYIESFINDRANGKSKVIRIPKEKSTSPEHLLDAALAKKNHHQQLTVMSFGLFMTKKTLKAGRFQCMKRFGIKQEVMVLMSLFRVFA